MNKEETMKSVRSLGTARRILAAWLAILLVAPLCCCQVRQLVAAAAGDAPSCCAHSDECADGQDKAPGEPCQDCHGKQPRLADGGQPTMLMPLMGEGLLVETPVSDRVTTERPIDRLPAVVSVIDDRRPPGWRLALYQSRLI